MANGTPATALTAIPTATDLESEVRNLYDARDYIQTAQIKIREARRKVDTDLAKWAVETLRPGPKADVSLTADAAVKRMKEADAEIAKLSEQEKALQAMEERIGYRLEQLKTEVPYIVARELERRRRELEKRRERLAALVRELKALLPSQASSTTSQSQTAQRGTKRTRKTAARKAAKA
jgi:hypothetical protein